MKKLIILAVATMILISCSNSNNKIKKKKPQINKFEKTLCFFRLRHKGCYDWMEGEQT